MLSTLLRERGHGLCAFVAQWVEWVVVVVVGVGGLDVGVD